MRLHPLDALGDHRGQLLAFAAAAGNQIVECFARQGADLGQQLLEVQPVVREHARPAQDLAHRQAGAGRDFGQHRLRQHRLLGGCELG